MKVFISWSGEDSRKIASELYEWLPMVVQSIQPYMSSESIDKGTRWASSIANELEGTHVGIVVLTPNNVTAPWINFEAGALAKIVDDTRLAPILFGLKPSDVGTPYPNFRLHFSTRKIF
ncbi:toll/interleukin-1 receptor domain-containing protein [Sphingobium scionense]